MFNSCFLLLASTVEQSKCDFTLYASWSSLWISNLVVMVPSCFRPILMVTSGFSTACFLPWWHGLFGYSHWAGMAELQLKSKSWAVLLPNSHQHLPQSEVGISYWSTRFNTMCSTVEYFWWYFFFCPAKTESLSTTNISMSTTHPSPSQTPTDAPVTVESRLSTY